MLLYEALQILSESISTVKNSHFHRTVKKKYIYFEFKGNAQMAIDFLIFDQERFSHLMRVRVKMNNLSWFKS